MRAGATALGADLFDRLPRYEGHLNRELDKSLARYARMKESCRRLRPDKQQRPQRPEH